jgi:hypothetical protein
MHAEAEVRLWARDHCAEVGVLITDVDRAGCVAVYDYDERTFVSLQETRV